ncbi:hypothetical protein FXF46_11095 [Gluconobacter thailandicus]|uniref:Uncharacterized protein n=1 Tax=Gluconobacter thailandicus TaxID=257438 RepID=A0AAP9ESZ8_GLUTH|nr:hypothetical protein FXF46_11095 [Gluconobacter thailandicus]
MTISGMQHYQDQSGFDTFSASEANDGWVSNGQSPEIIFAFCVSDE